MNQPLRVQRSSASPAEYVTVGHVTRDVIERRGGRPISQPGGGALYSALQAARLGLRALIVTQGVEREIRGLLAPFLDELEVCVIPAPHTTTLATSWVGEERFQRVLAWAGPISKALEIHTRILHLAPVARELPIRWEGTARFVGITPQGLARHWREDREPSLAQLDAGSLLGDVPLASRASEELAGEVTLGAIEPDELPARFHAAVVGERECPHCRPLFAAARALGAPVAVTAGARPTTVHLPDRGERPHVVQATAPPIARVREDLGAGDVFAAAFFLALDQGLDPLDAARFGNAAAAVRIADEGPNAVGTRARIEAITPDPHQL
jgi:pfkB family carbohydrate kinase